MPNNISSDFFTAPTQQTLSLLSFCKTDIKSLKNWLSTLPSVQMSNNTKVLLQALKEIHSLNCDELLRFELIQILHASLEQLLSILEKDLTKNNSFISTHAENLIYSAQEFRCYIAKTYSNISKNVHNALSNQNFSLFSFKQKKQLLQTRTISTYLALEQLSILKYQQLMVYKNPLIGQWQLAHNLYSLSISENFNDDIIENNKDLDSIHKVYKQINLLDILNTHQVRPIEIHALYHCSFQWIRFINLSQNESILSRYFIDINKDYPPILNNLHLNKSQHDLFIETQGLLEHINLLNAPTKSIQLSLIEQQFLSSSLLFHIQNLLNHTSERRYERYTFRSNVQITFNLQTAHYYLSQTQEFEETLQLDNKIKMHLNSQLMSIWNSEANLIHQNYLQLDQEAKHIYTCNIIDISVNGYKMSWKGKIPPQLRTGEFILIQEHQKSPWRGGSIRWMKQVSHQNIEFGVEILSEEITPCAVQLSTNKDSRNYHPSLLIKNKIAGEDLLSLIVPGSQICKQYQNVFLRIGKKQLKIYFTKTRLISQSFTQLDFELLNQEEYITIDTFMHQHEQMIKKQDLWESLK